VGAIDEMAQKAIELLSDESLLNLFKENAKNQAMKFSIEKIIPLYEQIYMDLAY